MITQATHTTSHEREAVRERWDFLFHPVVEVRRGAISEGKVAQDDGEFVRLRGDGVFLEDGLRRRDAVYRAHVVVRPEHQLESHPDQLIVFHHQ